MINFSFKTTFILLALSFFPTKGVFANYKKLLFDSTKFSTHTLLVFEDINIFTFSLSILNFVENYI